MGDRLDDGSAIGNTATLGAHFAFGGGKFTGDRTRDAGAEMPCVGHPRISEKRPKAFAAGWDHGRGPYDHALLYVSSVITVEQILLGGIEDLDSRETRFRMSRCHSGDSSVLEFRLRSLQSASTNSNFSGKLISFNGKITGMEKQ
jgi:hypothetical protein